MPFKKGSEEARQHMANIRKNRKKNPYEKGTADHKRYIEEQKKRREEAKNKKIQRIAIKEAGNETIPLHMMGDAHIVVPEFFGKVSKSKKGKEIVRLVNPLTQERNLSTRGGKTSIDLKRKPVKKITEVGSKTEYIPLRKFNTKDRAEIVDHLLPELKANAEKHPDEIRPAKRIKNKERGRPETLPENIRINRERGYKKPTKKTPKSKEPEPEPEPEEESEEEPEPEEAEEPEEKKRGRKIKYETEEERKKAIAEQKKKYEAKRKAKRAKAKEEKKGTGISAKDLKQLHTSAYKKDKDKQVGDWVLDESISKPTAVVYVNQKTKEPIVLHRGTEGTVSDWANNLRYVTGTNKSSKRYKDSEQVQKEAEAKYGDTLTSGHSQGAIYSKFARNKKGVINVNPASMGEVSREGTTIRSKTDPVSILAGLTNMFSSNKKNITTSAKVNPLEAHSLNILDELGDKELGNGLRKDYKQAKAFVGDLLEGNGLRNDAGKVLKHLVSHITDLKEPVDNRDFTQAKMLIDSLKKNKISGNNMSGRGKKGRGILDEKFSINDVKNTGRELFGRGILDEKFSINDVKNTGQELFGRGLNDPPSRSYSGGGIHHHHYYINGEGMFDFLDPNKNGVANAFDPNKNGIAEGAKRTVDRVINPIVKEGRKTFTPKLGRQIASTLIHKALPAVIQQVASSGTTALTGNPVAGFVVGNTAGRYAGQKAGDALGDATGYGFKKGSREAHMHMAKIRAMRGKNKDSDSESGSSEDESVSGSERDFSRPVKTGKRFVKGSREAKEYMAKIRAMRKR
jgi:hypothetical protein